MRQRATTRWGFVLTAGVCAGAFALALARGRATRPAAALETPPKFRSVFDVTTFQKGNLHAHSSRSDGDSTPEEVITWYRDHGYRFLALSDHGVRSDPRAYSALERADFKLVSGEEVTMTGAGRAVHVNALCTEHEIAAKDYGTAREALDDSIASIRRDGGIALVNHPNFDWALTLDDVRETRGASLLEVWSGHPYVRTRGDAEHPSHEAMWDAALSAGNALAPAGVDDEHHLGPRAAGDWEARPGRSWVQVFADHADAKLLCEAMRGGRLYASSGAEITRLRVIAQAMTVWPASLGAKVEFIGQSGGALASSEAGADGVTYRLKGGETYVRARVTDPDGTQAFLPAVFVDGAH